MCKTTFVCYHIAKIPLLFFLIILYEKFNKKFCLYKKYTKCSQTLNTVLFYFVDHHHHHVALLAQISLTLFHHPSLPFITSGRSSRLNPVSAQNCWILVLAGRPTFARPCEGVHRSKLLMRSSLLLQQCPACLVHLTWMVFVMGGRWCFGFFSFAKSTNLKEGKLNSNQLY